MQQLTEAARNESIVMTAMTEAAVGDSAAMKQIACVSSGQLLKILFLTLIPADI